MELSADYVRIINEAKNAVLKRQSDERVDLVIKLANQIGCSQREVMDIWLAPYNTKKT